MRSDLLKGEKTPTPMFSKIANIFNREFYTLLFTTRVCYTPTSHRQNLTTYSRALVTSVAVFGLIVRQGITQRLLRWSYQQVAAVTPDGGMIPDRRDGKQILDCVKWDIENF